MILIALIRPSCMPVERALANLLYSRALLSMLAYELVSIDVIFES